MDNLKEEEEIKESLENAGYKCPNPHNYKNHLDYFKELEEYNRKLGVVKSESMNGRHTRKRIYVNGKKKD